jgi:hypothetical protein
MNTIRWMVSIVFLVMFSAIEAATFKVHNEGTNTIYVRPIWNGRAACLDRLAPGQSAEYNSWFEKVTGIHWAEQTAVKEGSTPVKGEMIIKGFTTGINLGGLNLGGNFKIQNSGSFNYNFGVDGSSSGIGSAVDGL